MLLGTPVTAERFVLSAENLSFHQVFDQIAAGFGKKKPSREATPLLAAIAWKLEGFKSLFTGRDPLLTRETSRLAQSKTYFDNRKILQALPEFRFTPVADTISRTCAAYLKDLQNKT